MAGVPKPRPATRVHGATDLHVDPEAVRYVSRGGRKLAAAIEGFEVSVRGRRALDVGASTGGFTDCLLQRGAAAVTAVDVGTDQLHDRIRHDPRVTVLEQADIRELVPAEIGAPFDLIVVDVSFVSVASLAGVLAAFGSAGSDYIVLVKPQFEAGPDARDRRGVVGDEAVRTEAIRSATAALAAVGFDVAGSMASPVTGTSGNIEHLLWLRFGPDLARVTPPDDDDAHD